MAIALIEFEIAHFIQRYGVALLEVVAGEVGIQAWVDKILAAPATVSLYRDLMQDVRYHACPSFLGIGLVLQASYTSGKTFTKKALGTI